MAEDLGGAVVCLFVFQFFMLFPPIFKGGKKHRVTYMGNFRQTALYLMKSEILQLNATFISSLPHTPHLKDAVPCNCR